ncbi:ROK family protein [Paenibacillus swuensis]|uniref:ROK family protein n=1 Tax=Paenibacillus swuensis TaxID=1178515 RepID=UPI0008389188|nr:ROK family protein [Paenibacillus swuensis]
MRRFLTFDIGGTWIKYGVLNEDGTIVEKHEVLSEAQLGGAALMEKVKSCGGKLLKEYQVSGVCISSAGQVDSKEGTILYASDLIPEYTGTPVKQLLEAHFQLPVEVENDVNCAGYAESWIGTGKDAKSLFCLTIGTGIGGSYILDNKLHTGHSFSGGEIGYIPIEGSRFEELASTRILVRNVTERKGMTGAELDGKAIFELAQAGDEVCVEEIQRMVYYMSKGIATIAYMMNPELIIIGGGITAQSDYLYPLIREQLKQDLIAAILNKTDIRIAKTLNNAGMIGALRHFLLQESLQPLKSVTTMIESQMNRLTKREQDIAKYIMQNMESVPNYTISELARQINVSEATITRFCQKLEFGSYHRLRMFAKEAFVSTRLYEPSETGSLEEVKEAYLNVLKKMDTLYNKHDIVMFKRWLKDASQVFLYGGGELSLMTQQLKLKLIQLGIRADAFSSDYEMESSTSLMNEGTLVVGICTTGYTSGVVAMLERAKASGARTVAITSQQDAPLTKLSDLCLLIPSVEGYKDVSSLGAISAYGLLDVVLKELQGADLASIHETRVGAAT